MTTPPVCTAAPHVAAHFPGSTSDDVRRLVLDFIGRPAENGTLPVDHLSNALYLATSGAQADDESRRRLLGALWRRLSEPLA
jgi:hypothetical protein